MFESPKGGGFHVTNQGSEGFDITFTMVAAYVKVIRAKCKLNDGTTAGSIHIDEYPDSGLSIETTYLCLFS
jgi:hypothetical protein